jgi:hypothetical protein
MKYLVLQLLFLSTFAFADHGPASCRVFDKSVIGHSPSGIAQVSNLGLIWVRCYVAARPALEGPGAERYGLKAKTTVYKVADDGTESLVPSDVSVSGGGSVSTTEWVDFYVSIPLDSAERDAEIQRYIANLEKSVTDEQLRKQVHLWQMNPQALAPMVSQYRVGRFRVDCRVLDGDRVIGSGDTDLQVLFKGRFSDVTLEPK